MKRRIVSLTLARGGSKGIARKNLVLVNGKPLISYVLTTAKQAGMDEVWVSTEDEEIAEAAVNYGAKISRRPPEMARDHSACEEAIMHFAERVKFDWLVFIQNTSPLVTVRDIKRGLEMMETGEYESVFTATKEHWLPRWTIDVHPENWDPNNRPPRQLMPEKYVENGAFYITTRESLMKSKCRYSGRIGVVEIPLIRSFQIDTAEDLELIELLIKSGVK